jgi:hypothetical protein
MKLALPAVNNTEAPWQLAGTAAFTASRVTQLDAGSLTGSR